MGADNVSFVGYGISAGDMPGFDILFRSMSDFEEKRGRFGGRYNIERWKLYDLIDFLLPRIDDAIRKWRRENPFHPQIADKIEQFRDKLISLSVSVDPKLNISLVFEKVVNDRHEEIYIFSKHTYLRLFPEHENEILLFQRPRKETKKFSGC